MQALSDCIKEIRDDPNIFTFKEARIQLSIILRILNLLDWDIFREIIPEYGVENRSVDYALQINGDNEVFIEAKNPQENLENHQEQLLDYCFREGVELAILTNGIEWWFYLPLKKGTWNDRKFYTINILEQEIEDIVDKFALLLSRQNVASGKAVQNAKSILKSRQRERLVSPKVSPPKRFYTKTPRQTKNQTRKPRRMQIDGESYELEYKYEILVNTANWLIDKGSLKPSDCPVKLTSRSKTYFINRTPERAPDHEFWRPQKLKNGLFIEGDRSDIAIENTKKLLKKYGYDPKILQIEY